MLQMYCRTVIKMSRWKLCVGSLKQPMFAATYWLLCSNAEDHYRQTRLFCPESTALWTKLFLWRKYNIVLISQWAQRTVIKLYTQSVDSFAYCRAFLFLLIKKLVHHPLKSEMNRFTLVIPKNRLVEQGVHGSLKMAALCRWTLKAQRILREYWNTQI